MRKVVFFFFLIILFPTLRAQMKQHTFSVNYGIGSAPVLLDMNTDLLDTHLGRGLYEVQDTRFTGNVNLSYFYSLNRRFAIGTMLAYERIDKELDIESSLQGSYISEFYILQFNGRIFYINSKSLRIYSGLGVGGGIWREVIATDEEDIVKHHFIPSYQLNLVGIEYGDRYGIKAELGFGYQGIFEFGFFSRL